MRVLHLGDRFLSWEKKSQDGNGIENKTYKRPEVRSHKSMMMISHFIMQYINWIDIAVVSRAEMDIVVLQIHFSKQKSPTKNNQRIKKTTRKTFPQL